MLNGIWIYGIWALLLNDLEMKDLEHVLFSKRHYKIFIDPFMNECFISPDT